MAEVNKNCGIYKITSPTGRVYIGQALNIRRRFKEYKWLTNCSGQVRLYRSFKKHGIENHQFDTIEYCTEEQLNCSERFWQDEFDVIGKNGLNCILQKCGEKRAIISEETRKKNSNNSPIKGTRGTTKISIKVIDVSTGIEYKSIREASFILGISHKSLCEKLRGDVDNNSTLMYLHEYLEGKNISRKENKKAVKVLNTQTGVLYKTITEAAIDNNIPTATLREYLRGICKNKTALILYTG